jgi:hypothetical protein
MQLEVQVVDEEWVADLMEEVWVVVEEGVAGEFSDEYVSSEFPEEAGRTPAFIHERVGMFKVPTCG